MLPEFGTHNFDRHFDHLLQSGKMLGNKNHYILLHSQILDPIILYIYILVYTILICIILPLWLILQPLTHQKLSTVEAHQNIRSAVSENVSLRRFSGPLVSYPSADSGHGLLQHHLEKLWKSGNTAETN